MIGLIAICYQFSPASELDSIYQNIIFNTEVESSEDLSLLNEIQFQFMIEYIGSDSEMTTRIL